LGNGQEVENVHSDIRIVNTKLCLSAVGISDMKAIDRSAPLPITMPNEKFVQGVEKKNTMYNDYESKGL